VTGIVQMTRASITFSYRLMREGSGELLALGETKHVCIGADGKILKSGLSGLPFKTLESNGQ
jgi:acyl-CoA thioesterase FadM